ncbi:MAG: HAD hydrolase family protein [Flavobacteriia bacterium]|nr:HAD hydrolase family protein [Flavobacteriia bacterium]
MYLEQNIKGYCQLNGLDYLAVLSDFDVEHPFDLSINELETFAEEMNSTLFNLLYSPIFPYDYLKNKLKNIKFLVLDVDGVMTDAGMYYTENGDQIKKFNAKDGMGIQQLLKNNIEIGIISSGFYGKTIEKRAEILKIKYCYVGREEKISILKNWMNELHLDWENIAIIGDDVNDLDIMSMAGFSACPSDSVVQVKKVVNLTLNKKGGEGCIREFIDYYFLPSLLNNSPKEN